MSKKPIRSELSVAGTQKVEEEVKADLEEETEDKPIKGIDQYIKSTGGTRNKRMAEAQRLWEQKQTKKK